MKKIINRKTYNTETADEIAYYRNNYNCGDFNHYEETLYRTKKGNYFLHGRGGPLSKYAEPYDGGWSGSSDVVPISEEDVINWLEETGNHDKLEEMFPDEIEEA
jgi:hypothetical protein